MNWKKTIRKIHMWLGIITGPIVFIVAITGAIYTFQNEIQDWTQPYRFVEAENKAPLPPSELLEIAREANNDRHIHAILYGKPDQAAQVEFYKYTYEEQYFDKVYINQYNGEVLEVHDALHSFFGFILKGHFYLWLPPMIGQPVVAISTLIFFCILISGIYLWWPRNKNNKRQKFKIKWNARWRRKNYDLHSVIGFYSSLIALIFVITGLVWGFKWFRNTYYYVASGGESYVSYSTPDTPIDSTATSTKSIDIIWSKMNDEYPTADWVEVHPAEEGSNVIAANANPDASTYYKMDYRYFDQNTLEELSVDHQWGRTNEISGAQMLMKMNYDIHVGAIAGIPGKIIAMLISLLIASLPITGFLMWYGRKYKTKK